MHASFPYETTRNSRNEYGVVRRSEMLMQSHPGLDDPALALHNALAGVVDDNQVRLGHSLFASPHPFRPDA